MVTTMKVSATTKSAADPQNLASDFVQECLGFHTTTQQQSKKLDALWNIRSSLQSCFVGGAANVDDVATTSAAVATSSAASTADNADAEEEASQQRLRQEWRIFLEGHSTTADDDEDDGFNDASDQNGDSSDNFMLRDSLIQCLGESCCHPPPPNSGDGDDTTVNDASEQENENLNLDVMESSLCCLTHLIRFRCDDATDAATNRLTRSNEKKKKKLSSASSKSPAVAPIFGHAFVTIIAANVVDALQLDDDGDSSAPSSGCSSSSGSGRVPHAASQLLIALLRCDRPRNEMCPPTIRDLILLPACNSAAETSSTVVAHVAQILSTSIISGVEKSVTVTKSMDEEELSMRRETAALNQLQDMRDVVMSVGLVCSQGLGQEEKDAGIGHCTKQILHALQEIHDIAAFAVESQLETLLGDERAMPILARLRSNQAEDNIVGVAAPATGGGGGSSGGTMDDEITEDGKESKLEELTTLAPIYSNIAKPPIFLTTLKHLETMLLSITDKLNATHASMWDARLNALIDLECILAGGVASMSHEARYLFVDKLRKMPLQDQFQDLRSQITQQVCRVMVATSYEYLTHVSNDAQLNQSLSHLVECLIFPAILNLCKSGTRLMATQGMHCLLCLNAVCGRIGYPRTVPRYCEEILGDGKVHKNRKRGSVMALTVALRVWDTNCFVGRNNLDQLAKATKEAATNRDPAVREEGRKMYWAMHACCDETSSAVAGMFDESSREMKNLKKEQDGIDSEWEEVVGVMSILVETGVLGQASKEEDAAKKGTKKQLQKSSSRVPPPSGRSSIKRPAAASVRLRAEHGTPFKTQRVISTPVKVAASGGGGAVAGASTSKKLRPPSSATGTRRTSQLSTPSSTIKSSGTSFNNRNSSHDVISSSSKIPRAGPSTTIAASTKSEVVAPPPRSAMKGMNSPVVRLPRREGKENSSSTTAAAAAIMKTPIKSVGFNVNHLNSTSPVIIGTPIVNLLARASPLSAEKVRNTGDVLGTILSMLSDTYSPHEQSLGIKALALFAKEEPRHGSWEEKFPLVLECLLDQIKSMPTAVFEEPVDFIRSPSKKSLSSCHQMQHLFLQGVRSLLQFISGYVKSDQVKDIVCSMLECTNDAPFEIVHTAERALHNLVTNTNPETCFEHLLPFTCVEIDLNDKSNPPALLSTLRTMRYLVDRISIETLKRALPSLLPLFHMALCHKSVDMRKATVFILVEVYFVLGEEDDELGLLDEFTDCQRRLVDVYIERHPKNKLQIDNAKAVVPRSNAMSMQPISA